VGLALRGETTQISNNEISYTPIVIPEPEEEIIPEEDTLPIGTYYMVANTREQYSVDATRIAHTLDFNSKMSIEQDGTVYFSQHGQSIDKWSCKNNVITFESGADFINEQFDLKTHDETTPEEEFKCVYDRENQIIRMTQNGNSLELKYFESPEKAAEFLAQFANEGNFVFASYYSDYTNK
jgi:hypothetical protein